MLMQRRAPAMNALSDVLRDLAADKAHHKSSSKFQNPWPSFTEHGMLDFMALMKDWWVCCLKIGLLVPCGAVDVTRMRSFAGIVNVANPFPSRS